MERTQRRTRLLVWYRRHARALPWRATRDPYAIWISEVMLQQTRVDTVVPRYAAFLERFPSIAALARATVEEVCEAWAGLGYYRRARGLHAAAQVLMRDHGGVLPEDVALLLQLPGVGRYTAGAIASIAFGKAAPIVDGNVARVLARWEALGERLDTPALTRRLWDEAQALVRGRAPGDLNQALMELGALVCTPRAPRCGECPVRAGCRAHAQGEPERYPVAAERQPRAVMQLAYAWLETPRGVRLVRRPVAGLWAGQWELPSAVGVRGRVELEERLGLRLVPRGAVVAHELTHRRVRVQTYVPAPGTPRASLARAHRRAGGRLVARPLEAPLAVVARRAIERQQDTWAAPE